ncbi:LysR substrate-binding domain-containing protein [Pelagibius sp. Alg239-R121]|uniref:LysR substrate-binding domain-containing protein n=1 Tax=Pelagibius sp. Alg239-R121 TaxID=2993448 RepID=UPI0024A6DCDC|nr:LysR substrate-binding domain-containing protein [Pelagibius sp. Alg239-R121]
MLPPFAAIRAFDAAARHLSFKDAAIELGLTPTAISHQIKQLEALCGQPLFIRHTRRVELTPNGLGFAESIGPAIANIAAAFAKLSANPGRRNVTLGAGPIFSARWLVPRLADFWSAHPSIDLRLHHSPLPVWQQMAQFDLAVAWGKGDWPAVRCEPLLRIEVSPVFAPSLLKTPDSLLCTEDLLSLPLLHHRDDKGWRQWFEKAGVMPPVNLPGTIFEDANVLLQAALAGRGIALGILQFVGDELAAGRLLRPFETSLDPEDAYYLIYQENALSSEATAAVRDWLLAGRNRKASTRS